MERGQARRFIHLSDLHFGRTDSRLAQGLLDELHRLEPELLVISGDLTQTAAEGEFREAVAFLEQAPGRPFVVPGNHDLPGWNVIARFLRRFARYRRYIGAEMNPVYGDDDLALVGLNTARTVVWHWNWAHGRVSSGQLHAVTEFFRVAPDAALRAVVMHHPLTASHRRPNQEPVARARLAAERFAHAGADMVLSGHLHSASIVDLGTAWPGIGRSIQAFQAGTCLSGRLRGEPNSFRLFEWSAPELRTELFLWSGHRFERAERRDFVRTPNGLEKRVRAA